jgi:drug/metabolite transporter (DMT)-like permease
MNPHRLRAYIFLLIAAAISGIAGPVIKFTLDEFSPLTFLVYRFAISSLVILFFLPQLYSLFRKPFTVFVLILIYGLITAPVALGLLFFGLDKTTALDETLISAMSPLVIGVGAVLFLKERITKREKVGMAIAFLGVGITIIQPLLVTSEGFGQLSGNLLILLFLFMGMVSGILLKKLLRQDVNPIALANLSFLIGFITLAPISIYQGGLSELVQSIKAAPLPYHLGVLYMALLSGNLAYTLGNKAQKTIEISEAALFTYLYPIFAIPLAVLWLNETITLPYIVGAIIITIGVVIAEYKKTRYN